MKIIEGMKIKWMTLTKQQHLWIYLVIFLAILLLSVIGWTFRNQNWSAEKILKEMMTLSQDISVANIDESQNPELALDPIQSTAYFNDVLIKTNEDAYAGRIEVFDNHQEALLRKQYLETLGELTKEAIDAKTFGSQIAKDYARTQGYLYVYGNTLVSLNAKYSSYQANQRFNLLVDILKQSKQKERNLPNSDDIAKKQALNQTRAQEYALTQKQNLEKSLDEEVHTLSQQILEADVMGMMQILEAVNYYQNIPYLAPHYDTLNAQVKEHIESIVGNIDSLLNEAEEQLDEEKLKAARLQIEGLTHEVFQPYHDGWSKRLSQIDWLISQKVVDSYKAECETYDYDHLLAYPEQYLEKKVDYRGEVAKIEETFEGQVLTIKVTPVKVFSSVIYWEDEIKVLMTEKSDLLVKEGDLIHVWGSVQGTTSLSSWFGQTKEIPYILGKYLETE